MSYMFPSGGSMQDGSPVALLKKARTRFTQHEIAEKIGVNARTVRRWEVCSPPPPDYIGDVIRQRLLGFEPAEKKVDAFTFIDLFAGIGGIRTGFEKQGGKCLFTSEWNPFAVKTYLENFPSASEHQFAGDITKVEGKDIPDHDVLLAGFPCQPFSIAGVSKKNALGKPHGFECTTQGTLFFDVARIIASKRPKAFLIENVKNLVSHDSGNTFNVVLHVLRDELGYDVHYKIIDGRYFVPQHRERIIIVGFREKVDFAWDSLNLPDCGPRLENIFHKTDGSEPYLPWDEDKYFDHTKRIVQPKYTLSSKLWAYLQNYAEKHREAGNGFGYGLVGPNDVSRTLSARYYKDGSEILVNQGKNRNPRRLTPRECARLMGFQDKFNIPVSDTQAYRQFGNSVVVPVIREVARIMLPHLSSINPTMSDGINSQYAIVGGIG